MRLQGQWPLTACCPRSTLGHAWPAVSGAYIGSSLLKLVIISASSRLSLEEVLRGSCLADPGGIVITLSVRC